MTRPRDQAAEMVELIESLGAEAVEAPMIRVIAPEDYGPLDAACAEAGRFDWIVFSSANAVEAFMQRLLASPLDLRALGRAKLCAVGPATTERLAKYGLKVDLVPAEYGADAIAHAFSESGNLEGLDVLIPRADIGREVVGDELRRQGVNVTEVVAYRTDGGGSGARGRARRLPHAARSAARRRDVHERLLGPQFCPLVRRRTGRGSAQSGGGGLDWTGHGGGGIAVRHPHHDHAGPVHGAGAR